MFNNDKLWTNFSLDRSNTQSKSNSQSFCCLSASSLWCAVCCQPCTMEAGLGSYKDSGQHFGTDCLAEIMNRFYLYFTGVDNDQFTSNSCWTSRTQIYKNGVSSSTLQAVTCSPSYYTPDLFNKAIRSLLW